MRLGQKEGLCMKKKILLTLLAAALMLVPAIGELLICAEQADGQNVLALDYEALPTAYDGTWTLTGAYEAEAGMLDVVPDACTLTIRAVISENVLVQMEKYVHADVYELEGSICFAGDGASYECDASWDGFTNVRVHGKESCDVSGANMLVIRGIEADMRFEQLTGVRPPDVRRIRYIGLNAEGQLLIGCSENHIEKDANAQWLYTYIFTRVQED